MVFSTTSAFLKLFSRPKMPGSALEQILTTFPRPETVKIRNGTRTEKLIETLVNRGTESLQVITDFDATLTRSHLDGKKCDSTYGIIANTPLISEDYRKKATEMYHKYYPIEINPHMTIEQKTPHVIEWYEKSHEFMVAESPRLKRSQISEMACSSTSFLRENANTMLETLHKVKVPVLVLSAGIGDLVEEVLKHNSVAFPNVKVISNFMEFDKNDDVVGFKDPLIHMYNKNEAAVHDIHSPYFEELKSRNNIILMGDSLGDINMDHGVSSPDAVLKIGFLNSHFDEHLEAFMGAFDIVLVDDQSMDFVNLLLSLIIKGKEQNE